MCIHEEIMLEMARIQQKHNLTRTELVAQMAQAIHVMLELIEPGLKAICAHFDETEVRHGD